MKMTYNKSATRNGQLISKEIDQLYYYLQNI